MLPKHSKTAIALALTASFATLPVLAADPPAFTVDSLDGNVPGNFYPAGPYPIVARDSNGDFVVFWPATHVSDGIQTSSWYLRRYNADATPKSDAVATPFDLTSAVMANDGSFAVVGTSYSNNGSTINVNLQLYAADGSAKGGVITVGSNSTRIPFSVWGTAWDSAPQVAVDDDGDTAVAWTYTKQNYWGEYGYYQFKHASEGTTTYAALYNADGSVKKAKRVIDTVFPVSFAADGTHQNGDWLASMAMNGKGNLVMTFGKARDTATAIAERRFNPGLVAAGGLVTLPDVKAGYEYPLVGIDSSGNFDIEWLDPADHSPYVSRYNATAALLGTIGPIETPTTQYADTQVPTLSVAPSGLFAVTWGTTTQIPFFDGSLWTTYIKNAQYFNADGTAKGAPIIIDNNLSNLTQWGMATAIDGSGNLVSIWTALLSDQSTDAILGRLTSAPQ